MDPTTIDAILHAVAGGNSPAAACRHLGVPLEDFQCAVEDDAELRERIERVRDGLGGNLLAALYKQALGGNVSAIAQWLRFRPPRDWQTDDRDTRDGTEHLDHLPDGLLATYGNAMATPLPSRLSDALSSPGE